MLQRTVIGWLSGMVASNRPIAIFIPILGTDYHIMELSGLKKYMSLLTKSGRSGRSYSGSGVVARLDRWRLRAGMGSLVDSERILQIRPSRSYIIL
jgi:hypothetical protein